MKEVFAKIYFIKTPSNRYRCKGYKDHAKILLIAISVFLSFQFIRRKGRFTLLDILRYECLLIAVEFLNANRCCLNSF